LVESRLHGGKQRDRMIKIVRTTSIGVGHFIDNDGRRKLGIQSLRSAFVAPVTAALPPQIEAARVAAIAVKPTPTHAESVARLKRSMGWFFR
jgi:hypothetical protein